MKSAIILLYYKGKGQANTVTAIKRTQKSPGLYFQVPGISVLICFRFRIQAGKQPVLIRSAI